MTQVLDPHYHLGHGCHGTAEIGGVVGGFRQVSVNISWRIYKVNTWHFWCIFSVERNSLLKIEPFFFRWCFVEEGFWNCPNKTCFVKKWDDSIVWPSKHCRGELFFHFSLCFWEKFLGFVSLQKIRFVSRIFFLKLCGLWSRILAQLGWFKKMEHSHLSGRVVNMGWCEFSQIIFRILGTGNVTLRTNHSRVVNWNIVKRCLRNDISLYLTINKRIICYLGVPGTQIIQNRGHDRGSRFQLSGLGHQPFSHPTNLHCWPKRHVYTSSVPRKVPSWCVLPCVVCAWRHGLNLGPGGEIGGLVVGWVGGGSKWPFKHRFLRWEMGHQLECPTPDCP